MQNPAIRSAIRCRSAPASGGDSGTCSAARAYAVFLYRGTCFGRAAHASSHWRPPSTVGLLGPTGAAAGQANAWSGNPWRKAYLAVFLAATRTISKLTKAQRAQGRQGGQSSRWGAAGGASREAWAEKGADMPNRLAPNGVGMLIRCAREAAGRTREQQAHLLTVGHGGRIFDPDNLKRWETEKRLPSASSQVLISQVYGLALSEVRLAVARSRAARRDGVLIHQQDAAGAESGVPWDQLGTVSAISELVFGGGSVDRRAFVLTSAAALTASAEHWRRALSSRGELMPTGRRRINAKTVDHIDKRLDHLRHLDDELGGGELHEMAAAELALTTRLIRNATYTDATGSRLYAAAAEASRIVAWALFDAGRHASAERFFEAALRASATAGDSIVGAYAMSFQAIQCYSTGRPDTAIALLDTATSAVRGRATPRMTAMLAARTARAHSKHGDRGGCIRALNQARTALDRGPRPDDPATLYWVDQGEIEQIAGSCALELGEYAQAVRCFDAAMADYSGEEYPRTHAIYLARAAEAHLALGDLDRAVERATTAVACLGGVDSARSTSTLISMRGRLSAHREATVVRSFLDVTG